MVQYVVNKWGVFTDVTVNQYWTLFGLYVWAKRLLQMNLCKRQYYLWQQLFAPILQTDKDLQLWTETEQNLLRL